VLKVSLGGRLRVTEEGAYDMATERANDPRAFRDFLDAKLDGGADSLTLHEYLDLWEYENSPEQEKEETLRAIQQGLADVAAGRTRPFEDFDREFRQKHGLPPRT
jgi:hypothetical protein